ncbi:hypothetical protein TrispH2_012075, partial [Trichoplax sp. H2]
MYNFTRYSTFLEVDSMRPIAWCIALIGIPLNLFLIGYTMWESVMNKYSIVRREHHHRSAISLTNPSIWLLFNLFVCDFIGSTYVLILVASDSYYTEYYQNVYGLNATFSLIKNEWSTSPTCDIAQFLANIYLFVAATLTMCIGIDRFILTAHPHSSKKITIKRAKIITVITWITGLVVISGIVTFNIANFHLRSEYYFEFYRNLCLGEYYLTTVHTVLAFIQLGYYMIVYSAVTVIYAIIVWKLRKSRLTFRSQLSSTFERRFQIMLTLITLTNVFASLFISTATAVSFLNGKPTQITKFQKILTLFPYSNTALDPM